MNGGIIAESHLRLNRLEKAVSVSCAESVWASNARPRDIADSSQTARTLHVSAGDRLGLTHFPVIFDRSNPARSFSIADASPGRLKSTAWISGAHDVDR